MTKQIVLVGGGGHCKACIDVIERTGFEIAGIIDKVRSGTLLDYEVIGDDSDLPALIRKNYFFLVTVGQVQTSPVRSGLFQKIKEEGGHLATVLSPSAIVSDHSAIGEGTIVMHQALVNASSVIGINCIINSKALVEHDCAIGDHTHVSTGAIINGGCTIGKNVFIGSGAVIAQGVEIADNVVVGAGSVVLKNILEVGVFVGSPARKTSK